MHFPKEGILMKIKTNKKALLAGLLVMAGVIVFLIITHSLWWADDLFENPGLIFFLSILMAVGVGAVIAFRFEFKDKSIGRIAAYIFMLLSPILSITMVEAMDSIWVYNMAPNYFVANYLCYLVYLLLAYAACGQVGFSISIANTYFFAFALVNDVMCVFRETPFLPTDFMSIGTAANVAAAYEPFLDCKMIMGSLIFAFILILSAKINMHSLRKKEGIIPRLISAGYVIVMLLLFFCTDVVPDAGYKPDFWNQLRGYHKSGSFFNYSLNFKYLRVAKPDGYDPDEISDIVMELANQSDYVPTVTDTSKAPNIICIMNETWTDLDILNDVQTNVEYNDYYKSLDEDTIKGYVSVPVLGAGTSNSEFEFLTGMSLSNLSSGSNVYDLYIKDKTPSLASELGELGYSKTAFHPYYGDGWNRENVYPLLGFDDFVSIEDIFDPNIIDTYRENQNVYELEQMLSEDYPGENIIKRRYVCDSYDFKKVEEMFEDRNKDEPFFLFNVTMQNHGGYTVSYSNFYEEVSIEGMSAKYNLANQFVSLMKETDDALEELIDYFKNTDEPTIILMFGDHHPYLEIAFYEELLGKSLDDLTIEELQKRYKTPFLIWANYDIDEQYYENISSNYLSTLLLETAGLPMSDYHKYLREMYKQLPVIDTVGYIDADGNYYDYDKKSEYDELLNNYAKVQYNDLIDSKNRVNELFEMKTD